MIKMNSYVYCVDNTGVAYVKVFQILGNKYKRVASYGDMVWVIVKSWDRSSGTLEDDKLKKRFRRGSIHRAIIVHTKKKSKTNWFNMNVIWI